MNATSIHQSLHDTLGSDSPMAAMFCLWKVGIIIVIPLSLIHPSFAISIGYGGSVAAMSLILLWSFKDDLIPYGISATNLLLFMSMLYGLRLAVFLAVRRYSVPGMPNQTKRAENKFNTIPKIIALDAVLAGLYVCMVAPLLMLVRSRPSDATPLAVTRQARLWLGVVMTLLGLSIEVVADQHKYLVKQRKKSVYGETRFVGPTGGLYRFCRHPNFFGDSLFWTGLYATLDVYLLRQQTILWICATLGWLSILNIMLGSAKRLDGKQRRKYHGQPEFEKWQSDTKASLVPFLL